MSTGAIIAIAVVIVLILIALLVLMPRMRAKAAERKREQDRLEAERRLERGRTEAADEHRSASQTQHKQAELAEQQAKKQRAEAEIHAKRAELHEEGLADEDLQSGGMNGRVSPSDRDFESGDRGRDSIRDDEDDDRIRPVSGGRAHDPMRDEHVRDVEHEPATDADGVRSPSDRDDNEFERGFEAGQSRDESGTGARRMSRDEEPGTTDDPDRGPLR